jgi:hypothetical protein
MENSTESQQQAIELVTSNKPPVLSMNELNYNTVDSILEKEKQHNKNDTWNKLDKTGKIQKLHAFAEKYGKTNNLPVKDIKSLKMFFIDCLEKLKLQKAKDVVYDKETREIISIPSLFFNIASKSFTLKIMDAKRVSTLKSLTPIRTASQTKLNNDNNNNNNNNNNNTDDEIV